MLVVVGACTLAAQALPEPRPRQPHTAAAVIELTAGVALIVFGVRAWLGREQAAEDVPAWTKSIDVLNGGRALGLGLLLNLRPKNVLLAAVVGVQLRVETLDLGATIVAVVLYVVIATSSLTIPIVLDRSSIPTGCNLGWKPWRRRLTAEAPVIGAVVLILIGASRRRCGAAEPCEAGFTRASADGEALTGCVNLSWPQRDRASSCHGHSTDRVSSSATSPALT